MTASTSSILLLPEGWTEHVSPKGRHYYYHAHNGISTYKRPRVKREKPVAKVLVPNAAGWLQVRTNKGNTFYFHPETKRSQWEVPLEIVTAVEQLHATKTQPRSEQQTALQREEANPRAELKRKADQATSKAELASNDNGKKMRTDEHAKQQDVETNTAIATTSQLISSDEADEQDDADWQRQIAEEMAAEAEDGDADSLPKTTRENVAQDIEALKAAFFSTLTSLNGTAKEVNPMAPWDLELPKFEKQPSLIALPVKEREEAFNQWCKVRIREKRAAKAASGTPLVSAAEKYQALLRDQVRSTRTKWEDFRAAFKKDARFRHFGTDKEREHLFDAHLVQLSEEKRIASENAQTDFLQLLSDTLPGHYRDKVAAARTRMDDKEAVSSVWLDAKQTAGLIEDVRYDKVGSSTRRLDLFQTWARGEVQQSGASHTPSKPQTDTTAAKTKSETAQEALRERADKVRQERERVMRQNRAALGQATRQESLLAFQQLLIDSIRDTQTDRATAMRQMARDARFDAPGLRETDKTDLLDQHLARLNEKRQAKLDHVFARHAHSLDAHAEDVVALTMQDDELHHGSLRHFAHDVAAMEKEYQRWNRERQHQAQLDFMQMLHESAFVEFWGRFKNSGSVRDRTNEAEDSDEDNQSGALLDMAAKVDLDEIQSILRNDARFKAFQHEPKQREAWIRQHLASLAAPAKSYHRD